MGFLTSSKGGLGVFIGPDGVGALRLTLRGRTNAVEGSCWRNFSEKAFDGNYLEAAVFNPGVVADALATVVSEVWNRRRNDPPEVAVVLDDHFTSTVFLNLVSLPPKRSEAEMILEHRIHENHPYLKQKELVLDFAALRNREGVKGQRRFIVTFMLRSFSEALKGCFIKADLFPASLDTAWSTVAAGLMEKDQLQGSVIPVTVLACYGSLSTTVAVLEGGEATHIRKSNSGLSHLGIEGVETEFVKTLSFFQERGFVDPGAVRILRAAVETTRAPNGVALLEGNLACILGIDCAGWAVTAACAAMGGLR